MREAIPREVFWLVAKSKGHVALLEQTLWDEPTYKETSVHNLHRPNRRLHQEKTQHKDKYVTTNYID